MQHISRAISSKPSEPSSLVLRSVISVLFAFFICAFAASSAWARSNGDEGFYYGQLTADEQGFYDALAAVADEFAIDANSAIAIEASSSDEMDADKAVQAFFLDHPEIFWVDPADVSFSEISGSAGSGMSVYGIDTSVSYFREGFDESSLPAMREAFSSRLEVATLGLTGTVADKAEYLMDWLSAYNAGWRESCIGERASSAYAALIDLPGSYDADSIAYANAYKCLLDAAGISNAVVIEVAESELEGPQLRAWNAVCVNGLYYAVDASWDLAPLDDGNLPCFLAGSDTQVVRGALTGRTFAQTHRASQTTVSGFGLRSPELAVAAYVEPDPVTVDATSFPDERFRAWLLDPRNALGVCADGILTASEAANVTVLDVSDLGIESLEGIGHFPALDSLDCSGNLLEELDVSSNAELSELDCSSNVLSVLDLSALPHLDGESLDATGNMLTSLVLPQVAGGSAPSSAFADQRSAEGFLPPEWHVGDESGSEPGESVALEGQTLVAVREAVRYLIEFDGGGASGSMDPVVVSYGSVYTVPSCGFVREGYRFTGWTASIPGADSRELSVGMAVSDLTCTDGARVVFAATWEPIAYTVSFDPGEFEPAEDDPWPSQVQAVYDEPFTLPALEVEDAARLVGWCTDEPGEGHIYVAGATAENLVSEHGADVVLYAIWADNPLSALRDHALTELEDTYKLYDTAAYTTQGRAALDSAYSRATSAIRASATLSSVDSALASAILEMAKVQTCSDAVETAVSAWESEHQGILETPVVRSVDMDAIVAAVNSASALSEDPEVQGDIDSRLASDVESLTEKRELSAAKTLRLDTLKDLYDGYDLSSYDGAGAARITTAYQEGVRAIDAAVSVADVETETETARLALAQAAQKLSSDSGALIGPSALSNLDADSASAQDESTGEASLSTSSFFLLLFLICGITALCVMYANVRDKARVRRR